MTTDRSWSTLTDPPRYGKTPGEISAASSCGRDVRDAGSIFNLWHLGRTRQNELVWILSVIRTRAETTRRCLRALSYSPSPEAPDAQLEWAASLSLLKGERPCLGKRAVFESWKSGSSSVRDCGLRSRSPPQLSSSGAVLIPPKSSGATLSGRRVPGRWTVSRSSAYRSSRCSTCRSMTCYAAGSPASVPSTCPQLANWRSANSSCCPPGNDRTSLPSSSVPTIPSLVGSWLRLVPRNPILSTLEA